GRALPAKPMRLRSRASPPRSLKSPGLVGSSRRPQCQQCSRGTIDEEHPGHCADHRHDPPKGQSDLATRDVAASAAEVEWAKLQSVTYPLMPDLIPRDRGGSH